MELPLHPNFKQAIVDSDGHDTQLSEIPDIAAGSGLARRHDALAPQPLRRALGRARMGAAAGTAEALPRLRAAREAGDVDEGPLSMGQDAGLIHDIPPAAEIVRRIVADAERILSERLPGLVAAPRHAGVA